MEPTEFEKWCAGELGYSPDYIMTQRRSNMFGGTEYMHGEIGIRYRAYTAGVMSMLPYKTPVKGATNELD